MKPFAVIFIIAGIMAVVYAFATVSVALFPVVVTGTGIACFLLAQLIQSDLGA